MGRTLFLPQNKQIHEKCVTLADACLPVLKPSCKWWQPFSKSLKKFRDMRHVFFLRGKFAQSSQIQSTLRSVFPELAKYTVLAFAAQWAVDVLFADMEPCFVVWYCYCKPSNMVSAKMLSHVFTYISYHMSVRCEVHQQWILISQHHWWLIIDCC